MEIDWPSLGVATLGAGIAGAAWLETRKARKASEDSAGTSKRSADASEQSAKAADRSALAAEQSVEAANRSANAAEQSAVEAARLTQIESSRRLDEVTTRHDALGPLHPGEIQTVLDRSDINDQLSLFGMFSVSKDYYVHAEGWTGTSTTPVTLFPMHMDAGKAYTFHIEHWPTGRTTPQSAVRESMPVMSQCDRTDL